MKMMMLLMMMMMTIMLVSRGGGIVSIINKINKSSSGDRLSAGGNSTSGLRVKSRKQGDSENIDD